MGSKPALPVTKRSALDEERPAPVPWGLYLTAAGAASLALRWEAHRRGVPLPAALLKIPRLPSTRAEIVAVVQDGSVLVFKSMEALASGLPALLRRLGGALFKWDRARLSNTRQYIVTHKVVSGAAAVVLLYLAVKNKPAVMRWFRRSMRGGVDVHPADMLTDYPCTDEPAAPAAGQAYVSEVAGAEQVAAAAASASSGSAGLAASQLRPAAAGEQAGAVAGAAGTGSGGFGKRPTVDPFRKSSAPIGGLGGISALATPMFAPSAMPAVASNAGLGADIDDDLTAFSLDNEGPTTRAYAASAAAKRGGAASASKASGRPKPSVQWDAAAPRVIPMHEHMEGRGTSGAAASLAAATSPEMRAYLAAFYADPQRRALLDELAACGIPSPSPLRLREIERFLRMMQYTIHGIGTRPILSLYARLERLYVPAGATVFQAGEDSRDGMYIIIRGKVGMYDGAGAVTTRKEGKGSASAAPASGRAPSLAAATRGASIHSRASSSTTSLDSHAASAVVSGSSPMLSLGYGPGMGDGLYHPSQQGSSHRHGGAATAGGPAPGVLPPPQYRDSHRGRKARGGVSPYGTLLCTFVQAQTVGENALIAGTSLTRAIVDDGPIDGRPNAQPPPAPQGGVAAPPLDCVRPVTCVAMEDCVMLRLSRPLFQWFTEAYPAAMLSFILTTTTRQWRVAYYLLVDFFRLRDAWVASLETPGHAPAFYFVDAEAAAGGQGGGRAGAGPGLSWFGSVSGLPSGITSRRSSLDDSEAGMDDTSPSFPPQKGAGEEGPRGQPRAGGASSGSKSSGGGAGGRRTGPVPMSLNAVRAAGSAVLLKQPGESIYTEGSAADSMYIVLSGYGVCHTQQPPDVAGPLLYSAAYDAGSSSARQPGSYGGGAGYGKASVKGSPSPSPSPSIAPSQGPGGGGSASVYHEAGWVDPFLTHPDASVSCADAAHHHHHHNSHIEGHHYHSHRGHSAGAAHPQPSMAGAFAHGGSGAAGPTMPDWRNLPIPEGLGVITRHVGPGCIAGGHACFVQLPHRDTLTAVTPMEIAVFPRRLFAILADTQPNTVHPSSRAYTLTEIALAVGRSFVPLLRLFLSLGLQRLWLRSGEVLFRAGEPTDDGLYVVISGRLRTYVSTKPKGPTIAEMAGVTATGQLASELVGTGEPEGPELGSPTAAGSSMGAYAAHLRMNSGAAAGLGSPLSSSGGMGSSPSRYGGGGVTPREGGFRPGASGGMGGASSVPSAPLLQSPFSLGSGSPGRPQLSAGAVLGTSARRGRYASFDADGHGGSGDRLASAREEDDEEDEEDDSDDSDYSDDESGNSSEVSADEGGEEEEEGFVQTLGTSARRGAAPPLQRVAEVDEDGVGDIPTPVAFGVPGASAAGTEGSFLSAVGSGAAEGSGSSPSRRRRHPAGLHPLRQMGSFCGALPDDGAAGDGMQGLTIAVPSARSGAGAALTPAASGRPPRSGMTPRAMAASSSDIQDLVDAAAVDEADAGGVDSTYYVEPSESASRAERGAGASSESARSASRGGGVAAGSGTSRSTDSSRRPTVTTGRGAGQQGGSGVPGASPVPGAGGAGPDGGPGGPGGHTPLHGLRVDIGRGETVGELSVLVREKKRAISAVCIRDCELVRISQAAFELITARYPTVMRQFTQVLARRYKELTAKVSGMASTHDGGAGRGAAVTVGHFDPGAPMGGGGPLRHPSLYANATEMARAMAGMPGSAAERVGGAGPGIPSIAIPTVATNPGAPTYVTIAIIPAGDSPPLLADFTQRLVHSLEQIGDGLVLHLTSAKLDMIFGAATAESLGQVFVRSRITAWLNAQEEKHRFIVFEADPPQARGAHQRHQAPKPASEAAAAGGGGAPRPSSSMRRSATLSDFAKDVGDNIQAGVRTLTRGIDSAVRRGIGISPSMMIGRVVGGREGGSGGDGSSRPGGAGDAGAGSDEWAADGADGATAWSKMCVQMADLCLLVGQASSEPGLSAAEASCVYRLVHKADGAGSGSAGVGGADATVPVSRSFARKELVLLHSDPTKRPSGTRYWIKARRVSWHHHLRTWCDEDFARLARFVCGKARGVVCGGGGSRGLAHLGVLRQLEDRGIGVDMIGGTSQGAFMSACYAMTLDTEACFPLVKRLANTIGNTWSLLTSLTLPIMSYFSGRDFNAALQDVFKDCQIEDLWIRYFCVSTDITNDACVSHTTGPLWRYCRASMTVLGLLPPLYDRVPGSSSPRTLIDGGYTNNLPVEVMRSLAPQVSQVICVDVENKDASAFEGIENPGDAISGWYLAWRQLLAVLRLGKPIKIPPFSEIALKVSYISHSMAIRELLSHADDSIIYIRPDVGTKYKLLDYHLMRDIVQAGATAARTVLDRWESRQRRRLLRDLERATRRAAKQQRRAGVQDTDPLHAEIMQLTASCPTGGVARLDPSCGVVIGPAAQVHTAGVALGDTSFESTAAAPRFAASSRPPVLAIPITIPVPPAAAAQPLPVATTPIGTPLPPGLTSLQELLRPGGLARAGAAAAPVSIAPPAAAKADDASPAPLLLPEVAAAASTAAAPSSAADASLDSSFTIGDE